MSNYLKTSMRFCMLFALILTVMLLSKPQKAQAFTCFTVCNAQHRTCDSMCNNLPGNEMCLSDCADEFDACLAAC
jgi:hypothetical protein